MTCEELYEYAKRNYPPGTEFIDPREGILKVRSAHTYRNEDHGFYDVGNPKYEILGMISKNTGAWVYFNGKWGVIRKSPNLIFNDYQIC